MPRKLFVMRHGERVDCVRGWGHPNCVSASFDNEGNWRPIDLNIPSTLPPRPGGWFKCSRDTPLTETGKFAARLTGQAFAARSIELKNIFCSPSYRCIETATSFIEGYGKPCTIHIDPGFFEWTMYAAQDGLATWLTPKEFVEGGYPVNPTYIPSMKREELIVDETLEEYYDRSDRATRHVLKLYPEENILIIGHGGSLECCTRLLVGKEYRTREEFFAVNRCASYLSRVELEETENGWKFVEPTVPPITISGIPTFEQAILEDDYSILEN